MFIVAEAVGATQATWSDEVGGTSVAAHLVAQNERSAWAAAVAANGGSVAPAITLTQPTYTNGAAVSGVINTAADGLTTSVARTRYTGGPSPTLVGPSPNPGTASCTSAGDSLQGGAPRPTSLQSNATCSTSAGFAYAEVGGAGESTTRDAVEFTFSRPVLGFGAWFGDLETRTDGLGVAAVVRLYGAGNVLLSDQAVQPGPSYLPQSNCGNTYTGCGNNTTRWLSFVADPALPVVRMVVIVGDDDAGGTGFDEGLSFIGPTLDLSTATISLAKSAAPLTDTNADGIIGAGDTVAFNFAVTNTGTLPVSNVTIADPLATELSCPPGPVASTAVVTCTGRHVLTQAEVDAGSITNTATATATAYAGTITSNSSTLVVPIASTPGLALTKTVTEPTFDAVGDVLHFQLTAKNTGNVTLTAVSVADPAPGTGAFTSTCPAVPSTLAPGGIATCAVTYAVTQADLDAGTLSNLATGRATAPRAVPVGPVTATAASAAVQQASVTLTKSVDQLTYDAVGDVLTYTVTATNNGNVTLTGVTVTDPAPGAGAFVLDCTGLPATLPPGSAGACTATYTVTQGDLDAGTVNNTAGAHANAPGGPVSAPNAQATSTAVRLTGLGIIKTVDAPTFGAVGDILTYTVTVTNTSNVTVHAVTLTDTAPGAGTFALNCSSLPTTLAAGGTGSCTATYTVTQTDLDDGDIINTAQASALDPANSAVLSPKAAADSTAVQSASLSVVKSVDSPNYGSVGDVLTYTITVTNTGNVTLTALSVTDPAPGTGAFSLDCAALPATLAPGGSGTCTATYTITQADLDAGTVTNAAAANATGPGGAVAAPESQATSSALQAPALSVVKSVDSSSYDAVGDVLTYTITVTNTGNVKLTALSVTDPAPGSGAFTLDCAALPATLAPGGAGSCTATYTVTQADLDAGAVGNVASASATAPSGTIGAPSSRVTSTAVQAPALSVVKSVDSPSYDAVGDVLTYTITVTNTGNVSLTGVMAIDAAPGAGPFVLDCANLPTTLEAGGSGSCTATYTVTQADLDAGTLLNTARASAEDPTGVSHQSPPATATSSAQVEPGLALTKTVRESTYTAAGDVLHFTITARNTGNVTLTQVVLADSAPGAGSFASNCTTVAMLAPGASSICLASYTVTASDLSGREVTNTASASAAGQVAEVHASATSKSASTELAETGVANVRVLTGAGAIAILLGLMLITVGRRRCFR